ncbi:MAG: hypothetical protein UX98_C0003G0024 [Parcubacteria group bacterium GW2011_GWA2_47_26]|nr:MAG: hypothetical protein UX98_C0003G0024 [Parcubacteria group bacterium GW2011_GWA2_47_26]
MGITIAVIVLFILGASTLTLALSTFKTRLQAPFRLPPPPPRANSSFTVEDLLTSTKDTDRDGLTDAQELQVYKTSPFLEDSDSDGLSDKFEIEAGTDPNCPTGKDCRLAILPSAQEVQRQQMGSSLYDATIISRLQQTGVPGISDANSIRTFLRRGGVSETVLNQFNDEALIRMFQEAQQAPSVSSSEQTVGDGNSSALPQNPTPQEIRDLLKSAGMDEDMLKKFDDATLLRLYRETLMDVNKNQN